MKPSHPVFVLMALTVGFVVGGLFFGAFGAAVGGVAAAVTWVLTAEEVTETVDAGHGKP
ncbi:hypothetical protein [Haloprofundus halophilus]|uniref:hypothetical protein n=1 Tax=Haloprofundus halophilus TaxID=2283527 RepID=UPI001300881F|nr:hypothetical protein [Haloprofundus halophilus]